MMLPMGSSSKGNGHHLTGRSLEATAWSMKYPGRRRRQGGVSQGYHCPQEVTERFRVEPPVRVHDSGVSVSLSS